MIEIYKQAMLNQFEAAVCMIGHCVDRCPDRLWHGPVVNLKFCQVAFHTLFFTDLYLGPNVDAFRKQSFHRDHADFFGDYEELEDRPPQTLYEKPAIKKYLAHCREKAGRVIAGETSETLHGPSGFDWLDFSRAELHPYNIRHLQHHAAQLSLRLRIDTGDGVPWARSG